MRRRECRPISKNTFIGPGLIAYVDQLYKQLGSPEKVLLVYDSNTKKIAGDYVEQKLAEYCDVCTIIITDADDDNVEMVKEIIIAGNPEQVYGIGGGRPIDVAKLASYRTGRDFVSIPTIASHDGIASARASIKNSSNVKVSKQAHAPVGLIADTEIMLKAPKKYYTAGIADLISNITATADWWLSSKVNGETVNEDAALRAILAASYIIDANDDLKNVTPHSLTEIVKQLVESGKAMQIAESSRPGSGAGHKISHALDKILKEPKLHGHQCGVASIFTAYLHEKFNKPCPYKHQAIAKTLHDFGAPATLSELGVSREDFLTAVNKAKDISNRYTILEFIEKLNIDFDEILDEIGL